MLSDLKYAFRQLGKSPGFTAVAMLTLAIGIGSCTAIFSVVNSVLLTPMGYPDSERLVSIKESYPPQFPTVGVSPANYGDWSAEATDVIESLYAEKRVSYNLTGNGEPVRVNATCVTSAYFKTLRSPPMLGRAFLPEEDSPGKGHVVVLNYGFWQRQLGGRPEVVGQTLRLNDELYTVIGVMPPSFSRILGIDLVAPMAFTDQERQRRDGHYLTVIARLKPGVTIEQAQARLATIAADLGHRFPAANKNWGAVMISLLEGRTSSVRPTLYTLLGAVGMLLLIACANVTNLLLVRATGREREITIRLALGASRWRVARQLVVEGLVLALGGGLIGVLLGKWGLDTLLAFSPPGVMARDLEVALDSRALLVTLGVTFLTGLGFSLAPAWQSSSVDLNAVLKEGSRGSTGGHRHLVRHGLVVAEIALALVLLTAAGLLLQNFVQIIRFDPGFEPHGALRVATILSGKKYDSFEKQNAFVEAVLERDRALPGVQAAAAASNLPLAGDYSVGLAIEGRDVPPDHVPNVSFYAVTPAYFTTMGIRLIRGRGFTDLDRAGGADVAVISASLAGRLFPNTDPIGQRISPTIAIRAWREVVGIVADVKTYGTDADSLPQAYTPFAQAPSPFVNFILRASAGRAIPDQGAIRREIYAVDPGQPVAGMGPLEDLLTAAFARQRFAAVLFATFSALALVLAAIGIYSVMAYSVAQRTGEFGIRMALGAQPRDLFRLVLDQGARLIGLGLIVGLFGAWGTARFIESILFQMSPDNPAVLGGIGLLLAMVAILACLIPARRATKVNPLSALRAE